MIEKAKATVPGRVALKFIDDEAGGWAVRIAWSSLLAMFPIILIAVAALGFILSFAGLGSDEVRRSVSAVFPDPDAQRQVLEAIQNFKHQPGLLAVGGFAGLALSGSALFGTMDRAFAAVYEVRPRGFLPQRLMSFGMILVFTVLIGLDIASSSLLASAKNFGGVVPDVLTSGLLAFLLQVLLGTLSGFILFAVIYFVVPNRDQHWSEILPGVALGGVLLEAVTLLFPLYLLVNRGIAAYGKTFGLLFLLMTFFFFLGLITMAGAELNTVLHPAPADRKRRR